MRHPFTVRPENERVVMTQTWQDLLFLHWRVPVETLRSLIPAALDLDTFKGEAYVGLVPFTMRNVRPLPFPAFAPLSNFHEINVRTYVRFQGEAPGVWFFSLDASNRIAVQISRRLFHLPYYFAKIGLEKREQEGQSPVFSYSSERVQPGSKALHAVSAHVEYTPLCLPCASEPGSLSAFLAERYLLYSEARGKLYRGQVHHSPYPLQPAQVFTLADSLVKEAGVSVLDSPPLAHYADRVDVEIFPLHRVSH